jgi:transposase-like protein
VEKSTPHRDPSDSPRPRANNCKGHSTYANDYLPIISVVLRETGEHRFGVCDHADTRPCLRLIAENVPADGTQLYTDEWQSYRGSHLFHATVHHGVHEWAQDDDGRREVHCNTCEGAGAGLRTYLRAFRGGHKP